MSNQQAPRCVVQGVNVLLLENGPYLEVAERVRLVHKVAKAWSFERGNVLSIHGHWIYRAYIMVDGQQYIGDAEIQFGAPPTTPDGTNPITCGQTSAIGNALAFAGFGTLKSVLARLGSRLESAMELSLPASRRVIQDVEVVMFDEQPYVDVAERLFYVHLTGKALSMHQCKLIQYNNIWIYRAWIMVDGQQYIGDAEVFFDATHEPDRTYPISCGQTSAVGNALAFAGFGDVRSILERAGKQVPDTWEDKPVLASADAVSRALQRAWVVRQQEGHPAEIAQNGKARSAFLRKSDEQKPVPIAPLQRERIRILCERLGESEPDYAAMSSEEADIHLVQLECSEEELLLMVDEIGRQEFAQNTEVPHYVKSEEVKVLKEAWLQAFCITGSVAVKRAAWTQFKRETCQMDVHDTAMLRLQHDQLSAAILAEEERRVALAAVAQVSKAPQVNGRFADIDTV